MGRRKSGVPGASAEQATKPPARTAANRAGTVRIERLIKASENQPHLRDEADRHEDAVVARQRPVCPDHCAPRRPASEPRSAAVVLVTPQVTPGDPNPRRFAWLILKRPALVAAETARRTVMLPLLLAL